jgi:2-succinyl-6-hydroxy-2,4-cyclohexadiene-1-carboxylate synthase
VTDWRPLAGPLAAQRLGEGERLVFLHGFTQTGRSWRPVAEYFVRIGYEVVLVDLPGHGGSSSQRADLRRTADLLATTTGAAAYIGYSLGGRVALHLALMYPSIVERLAVLGAHAGIEDEEERARRRDADDRLAERVLEIGVPAFIDEWLAQPLFEGLTVTDEDRADRLRNTADGLAWSLRMSGTGSQIPLWDRLMEFNMPVLAMAGSLDTKFEPLAERIAQSVPDGTFAPIHGAGHAAHLQQPAQLATRLELWLGAKERSAGIIR